MAAAARPAPSLRRFAIAGLAGACGLAVAPLDPSLAAPATAPTKRKEAPAAPAKPPAKTPAPPKATAAPPAPAPKTPPLKTQPPPAQKPETPPALAPLPPVDVSKPPPSLPRAARDKMRACAEEWDDLKRRTKVGELTWRAFATKCLTR